MAKKREHSSGLEGVDAGDLQREIKRREQSARSVLAKRKRLLAKLAALDEEIRAMGVRTDGRIGVAPRARNAMSLTEAMQKLLKGKEMGIPAIVPALATVGYKSSSPNLRTMVNAQLLKKHLFKRTGRGVYTAK